jgi:hypothetical protein
MEALEKAGLPRREADASRISFANQARATRLLSGAASFCSARHSPRQRAKLCQSFVAGKLSRSLPFVRTETPPRRLQWIRLVSLRYLGKRAGKDLVYKGKVGTAGPARYRARSGRLTPLP